MGERCVYRILVRKPERNRPLGRPRRRWEYNIKMDHQEVGRGGTDCIELAQDIKQAAGTCEFGNELSGSINGEEFD